MEKVVMYDPGVGTLNIGDQIISQGVYDNLSFFLSDKIVTSISTHTPLNRTYTNFLKRYDYKFICGSNLLMGKMDGRFRQWDINLQTMPAYYNCILVGVGWWQHNDNPDLYTKKLYKSILSDSFIHSVRDDFTKMMLKSIGVDNVINTGCATMWKFTPEFCSLIPTQKADSVVFTLTDYNKDPNYDCSMINVLLKNYKNIYFWPQGIGDWDYLFSLGYIDKVSILGNSLNEFDSFLKNVECDYVGTRLHGGIRALQNKRRTIILSIDNRAIEKKKDFNIPCIERSKINDLDYMIHSDFSTNIIIPIDRINEWKSQFRLCVRK